MNQEQRVDRMGANALPNPEKPNRARAAGAKAPSAPPRWIRNVRDYDRRQPREFQVMHFG
jgi:hypothetical protein